LKIDCDAIEESSMTCGISDGSLFLIPRSPWSRKQFFAAASPRSRKQFFSLPQAPALLPQATFAAASRPACGQLAK